MLDPESIEGDSFSHSVSAPRLHPRMRGKCHCGDSYGRYGPKTPNRTAGLTGVGLSSAPFRTGVAAQRWLTMPHMSNGLQPRVSNLRAFHISL